MSTERPSEARWPWINRTCKVIGLWLVVAVMVACNNAPVPNPPSPVSGTVLEGSVFRVRQDGVKLEVSYPLAEGAPILRKGQPFPYGELRADLPMHVTLRDGQIVRMDEYDPTTPPKAPEAGETVFDARLAGVGSPMGFVVDSKFAPDLRLMRSGKSVPITELKAGMMVRVTIREATIVAIEDLGLSSK